MRESARQLLEGFSTCEATQASGRETEGYVAYKFYLKKANSYRTTFVDVNFNFRYILNMPVHFEHLQHKCY